jgi:hypothetical protein
MLFSAKGASMEALQSIRLSAADEFPHYLRCFRTLLVRAEVSSSAKMSSTILEMLDAMGSEVCLPLINKDRLIGFINLGSRADAQAMSCIS